MDSHVTTVSSDHGSQAECPLLIVLAGSPRLQRRLLIGVQLLEVAGQHGTHFVAAEHRGLDPVAQTELLVELVDSLHHFLGTDLPGRSQRFEDADLRTEVAVTGFLAGDLLVLAALVDQLLAHLSRGLLHETRLEYHVDEVVVLLSQRVYGSRLHGIPIRVGCLPADRHERLC